MLVYSSNRTIWIDPESDLVSINSVIVLSRTGEISNHLLLCKVDENIFYTSSEKIDIIQDGLKLIHTLFR